MTDSSLLLFVTLHTYALAARQQFLPLHDTIYNILGFDIPLVPTKKKGQFWLAFFSLELAAPIPIVHR